MIGQYEVRVDDGRYVVMNGDIGDLDKIVMILSGQEALQARAAAAEAECVRLQRALDNEKEWTVAFAGDAKAEMDRAHVAEAKIKRLRTALAKALDWFEHAQVSYANGNVHNGLDEGAVIGGQMHDEMTEQIRCALHGLALPEIGVPNP